MTTTPVTINDIRRRLEINQRLTPQEILDREVARWEAKAESLGVPTSDRADFIRWGIVRTEAASTLRCIFADAGAKGIETRELPERLAAAGTDFVPVDVLKDMLLRFPGEYARVVDGVYYGPEYASNIIPKENTMTAIPVTINDIPRHIAREREAAPELPDRELLERATKQAMGNFTDPADVRWSLARDEADLILDGIFAAVGPEGIETCDLPEVLAEASTDFVPVELLMDRFIRFPDDLVRVDGYYYYAR